MNKLLFEMFTLFMACAASALIGYSVAVIRHDRRLRQVIESLIRDYRQVEEECEDAKDRFITEQINGLLERELNEVCNRMG